MLVAGKPYIGIAEQRTEIVKRIAETHPLKIDEKRIPLPDHDVLRLQVPVDEAAPALIESRGITVDQAYAAVMKRSNRESFDRNAAKAWDDAEDAALGAIFGDIDDWPDDAVLGLADEV